MKFTRGLGGSVKIVFAVLTLVLKCEKVAVNETYITSYGIVLNMIKSKT